MKSESQIRVPVRADSSMNSAANVAATWAAISVIGVVILAGIFFANRAQDVGQLFSLFHEFLSSIGRERIVQWSTFSGNVIAIFIAAMIACSWFGLGSMIERWMKLETTSFALRVAWQTAIGASLWSLLWFVLGVVGFLQKGFAIGLLLAGLILAGLAIVPLIKNWTSHAEADEYWLQRIVFILIAFVCGLALIAALAPPTGKDALVYRLAVPKAFLTAGGIVDVGTNVYAYLSFGAEMNGVWAMLLGNYLNSNVAEAAFGAMCFVWLPILLLATYGFAREIQLSRNWSLIAGVFVAAIPSLYQVATTGYVDHSLALFIVLAVQAAGKWWTLQSRQNLTMLAFALGGALAIKFIALFAFFPLFVVVLFKTREAQQTNAKQMNAIWMSGCAALLLGGALASPWYLRTWIRTGSPVYPFYAHLWNGTSPNWDADRSRLFQMWVSRYGGNDKSFVDYIAAPLRLSLTAQPEFFSQYDGVLGVSFLLGLPLLIWGLWRLRLSAEVKIAVAIAGGWYVCWLFSSQQMRFLLPIFPLLAIAIVAAASKLSSRSLQWALLTSVVPGVLVIAAWFLEQNPLRAVLGGEAREAYLTRRLDHYPYYEIINRDLPSNARVWLINMRNDTVHLNRDYFADYIFEDYTITKLVKDSANVTELRAKVKAMGITHVMLRQDVILDYARTPIVDERKSESENQAKLQLLKSFLNEGNQVIKSDAKFMLITLS